MNDLQVKSLTQNLNIFCKKLSDIELVALIKHMTIEFINTKPNKIAKDFIEEFFGANLWARHISDEKGEQKFFNKTTLSEQDLIRTVRIGLVWQSFFRFDKATEKKEKKTSEEDKQTLREILREHQAMLRYQLENEDFIRNSDTEEGEKLVDEKKRHLEFLDKHVKSETPII